MPTIEKFLLGSQTSLLTTELNSLANNALAISSIFNNTVGSSGDGYTLCDVELVVTYGVSPTANTGCTMWFIQTQDGTNYEDGSTSITPSKLPDCVFPLRVVITQQRIIRRIALPWGIFKVLLKNDGTEQSMSSSGNTLKIRPATHEAI